MVTPRKGVRFHRIRECLVSSAEDKGARIWVKGATEDPRSASFLEPFCGKLLSKIDKSVVN